MHPPKIVFLNSPPRTGKDTLGRYLTNEMMATLMSYGDFPKQGTHASFGLEHPARFYENCKDAPHDDFWGISPRQAYIDHAEKYMKPLYGQDVYGKQMAARLRRHRNSLTVVTDLGFVTEVDSLVPIYEPQNMMIMHIHRLGLTFEGMGDSRRYIAVPGVRSVEVRNIEDHPMHMCKEAEKVIRAFLHE